MLNWLKERQARNHTARELYGSIVTQARQQGFYADMGFPDTARGRFELLVLHTALVMRRLQKDGDEAASLARTLAETFITDMDDNMRELTFSDLAVPREVKKVAAALYDRHGMLSAGLEASSPKEDALVQALAKDLAYLDREGPGTVRIDDFARYVHGAASALAAQSRESLCTNGPQWPDPKQENGVSR